MSNENRKKWIFEVFVWIWRNFLANNMWKWRFLSWASTWILIVLSLFLSEQLKKKKLWKLFSFCADQHVQPTRALAIKIKVSSLFVVNLSFIVRNSSFFMIHQHLSFSKAHYLMAVHKCFVVVPSCLLLWLWWTNRHVLSFNYTQSDTRIVWATAQAACRSLFSLPIFFSCVCSMTCCRKWKYRWCKKFSTTQRKSSLLLLIESIMFQIATLRALSKLSCWTKEWFVCAVRGGRGNESLKLSFIFGIANNENLQMKQQKLVKKDLK